MMMPLQGPLKGVKILGAPTPPFFRCPGGWGGVGSCVGPSRGQAGPAGPAVLTRVLCAQT